MTRMPEPHARAARLLADLRFTASGIAGELNAQFGTAYSRRAVLLALSSPASGNSRDASMPAGKSLRGPAAHVRFPADAPPLSDGMPVPIAATTRDGFDALEAERHRLRRVDRLPLAAPKVRRAGRMDLRGSNVAAQAMVAVLKRGQVPHHSAAGRAAVAPAGTGVIAAANSAVFTGGQGVPLAECRECRWPVAGEGIATLFCDAPRATGSSYCPGHKRLAGGGFSFSA